MTDRELIMWMIQQLAEVNTQIVQIAQRVDSLSKVLNTSPKGESVVPLMPLVFEKCQALLTPLLEQAALIRQELEDKA